MGNCLLIFPQSFYSFSNYIKNHLTSIGYDVETINDEFPDNTLGKIMGTLQMSIHTSISEKVITEKYVNGKTYDLILIFKGRGMSKSLIEKFKLISPKVIAYNFDSFSYFKNAKSWYKSVNSYYTFDYKDAKDFCLPIIELFSSLPLSTNKKEIKYSVSAIVRNHSNRIKFIDNVLVGLNEKSTFVYIYEKNIISFAVNFFKNPVLYIKYRKMIHFKTLSYDEYINVLNQSDFTIDYAHPKQTGITIRCFEASSCRTKTITNNAFVLNNSNFNSTNTIVFNQHTNMDDFKNNYKRIKNILPKLYNRSIGDFMTELLK
jgi:hypothetical protein|tara:strand:- start:300 stop:1250 length:951 start_codon:yes stop_codon:yes gene_type:complete